MQQTLISACLGGEEDAQYLQIKGLTKKFDEIVAVDSVSIDIAKGEIFALLGSSGCGKSTLLRMLAGFEKPDEGLIILGGANITALPPYERPINMMFQSYALFPHLNVWDNIAFGLRRKKLPKDKIREQVEKMLSLVQLTRYAKRKPHQLSGGQQQRVALARSLAREPRLLLLDEPLGALDRKLRSQTQFELKNIIKRVGVTCVLVTHDQEEAMTMGDRLAVMNSGLFLQVGSPEDIYETPNCRQVADFIGSVNLFEGKLAEDKPSYCVITTPEGDFYVSHGISGVKGMEVSIGLRPEKISLQKKPPTDNRYNCLKVRVEERAYFGSSAVYRAVLENGKYIQVTSSSHERYVDSLEKGEIVYAAFEPTSLVVLTH